MRLYVQNQSNSITFNTIKFLKQNDETKSQNNTTSFKNMNDKTQTFQIQVQIGFS